ncbi:MAG: ATPase domain-containing protein [Candidatus Altiarchaeota archaeon]
MEERIKTGISGWDNLLGGGFIPNSINLLCGSSGSGKTLFTLSFLYNGAVEYKEKVVYITLEEMKEHIVRDCELIGLDFSKVDDDTLMMYDLSSLRLNTIGTKDEVGKEESPLRLENLLEFIKINYSDVTRLGLDSIVPLAIAYNDDRIFRAELFRFMMSLKKMGITVVFTTEISYSSNDSSRFGMEDFLADSVTLLRMREEWGRQIKVHKMRGSNHIKNFVDYDISTNGIKVMYK